MKNQMITEVSHVISISGVARIRTPDGVLHELKVGDVLQLRIPAHREQPFRLNVNTYSVST